MYPRTRCGATHTIPRIFAPARGLCIYVGEKVIRWLHFLADGRLGVLHAVRWSCTGGYLAIRSTCRQFGDDMPGGVSSWGKGDGFSSGDEKGG
jgi:hypothetical protein